MALKKGALGGEAAESIDARLDEMERKLDRLRVLYENFFMGVDRVPPNVPRRELNRLFVETQQVPIPRSTMRFRFQTLLQRWVLLTTYWNRTMREIEAGTYRRDVTKAYRHMAARGGAITEEEAVRLGIPAHRAKSFVARQNKAVGVVAAASGEAEQKPAGDAAAPTPATRAAARAEAAAVTAAGLPGLRAGALEDFYRRYVDAHVKAVGAPPKASLDQMRAKLQQDLPKILSDQRCERVELDVSVDGGKVRLRARPVR